MEIRSKLRAAAICVLATALIVSMTQALTQSAAQADEPVNVITSTPVDVGGGAQPSPFTIGVGTTPINGSVPITVTNPGGTTPTRSSASPLP